MDKKTEKLMKEILKGHQPITEEGIQNWFLGLAFSLRLSPKFSMYNSDIAWDKDGNLIELRLIVKRKKGKIFNPVGLRPDSIMFDACNEKRKKKEK
jgi:hypothetical protein